jgi:hypothetical protein
LTSTDALRASGAQYLTKPAETALLVTKGPHEGSVYLNQQTEIPTVITWIQDLP